MGRERDAALAAMCSGVYGVWRSTRTGDDCGRIGAASRCFCGRTFDQHRTVAPYSCGRCDRFRYVPQRPEEVGEWWLPRRKDFNVHEWRAKCQCQHGHDRHDPMTLRCKVGGCGCGYFTSAFCCIACDRPWEEHETVFETRHERKAAGRAVDSAFLPLAEVPAISEIVFGEHAPSIAAAPGRTDASGDGGGGPLLPRLKQKPPPKRSGPATAPKAAAMRPTAAAATKAASGNPFFRESVVAVYSRYAPEKLGEVDAVLARWAGREPMLLQRLHKKYGRVVSNPTSGR